MTIAVVDVAYRGRGAHAACAVIDAWDGNSPLFARTAAVSTVLPYAPGRFYVRELPCLLAVLEALPQLPPTVVVDAYVVLPGGRPGLGAHLHDALGGRTTVVGIAKTPFAGALSCPFIVPVTRGASGNPLFVTAVGMAPDDAARHVRAMAGRHRIPDIVRIVDRLARERAPAAAA